MERFDAIVIGAGAAGLLCAAIAGQRGAARAADRPRDEGGREDPHLRRRALQLHQPRRRAGELPVRQPALLPLGAGALHAAATSSRWSSATASRWHEKHKRPAVLRRLERADHRDAARRVRAGGVMRLAAVPGARACATARRGFELDTDAGAGRAQRVVVATGGLSIPKIGATDFGYRLARQFGHRRHRAAPGAGAADLRRGSSGRRSPRWPGCRCRSRASKPAAERQRAAAVSRRPAVHAPRTQRPGGAADLDLLAPGRALQIDLAPGHRPGSDAAMRPRRPRSASSATSWPQHLPQRLADTWLAPQWPCRPSCRCREARDRDLDALAAGLQRWQHRAQRQRRLAQGRGHRRRRRHARASSQSMESRRQPGLYFIGEVVDVTGWLGGYNFQWAWASAAACAGALASARNTV